MRCHSREYAVAYSERLNLLLSGPPASGKSRAAMERFRGIEGSRLLTPSSTMAEHVQHELARSGFAVRPSRITTLAQFLDSCSESSGVPLAAPPALLHVVIADWLERSQPRRFAPLLEFRGFHAALAGLLEEAAGLLAGGACGNDLAQLAQEVQARLAERGLALRNARLRAAASAIRSGRQPVPPHTVLDGFFTLAPAEIELVEALAERGAVTVTLPDFPGAEAARDRLQAAGFTLERFGTVLRSPRRVSFSGATPERESEEIARRILDHASRGRAFRDMGIVLRSRDPYGPVIETTFARFGIPWRSYFADALAAHPAVAFLSGLLNALLGGWDHAALAALMRMPMSGMGASPAGDEFDLGLRERLPGRGLPLDAGGRPPILLERLAVIDGWARERLELAGWAERLHTLRGLLPRPQVDDSVDRDEIHAWRSTAAALRAFTEVVDRTAGFLAGSPKIPLEQFWKQVETGLALEQLRIEDRRRDVVHVMDVFEARQWELPVVFVAGLLERDFPQYHRDDPLLDDAARRRLGLRTSGDRQGEERFLFDLAVTRATREVVLSYSRFNEKGEETLPSFFLDSFLGNPQEMLSPEMRVRPAPSRVVPLPSGGPVQDSALRMQLARQHRELSPTSIESFLQCPFQFFARKTIRLRARPPAPRDRLDALLRGRILHDALAQWARAPLLDAAWFDRVFEDACAENRIPATYRTEAVRLQLLRDFEGFLESREVQLGWQTRVEEEFRFPLNGSVTIRGRIDRLETGPNSEALVIDYKYSAGNRIRAQVEESEAGNLVQGGLYLLAAERALGMRPAGMLYCGLKKDVSWGGWHIPIPGLERIGQLCEPSGLRALMEEAERRAGQAHDAIASGRVEPQPANAAKCKWCDYRDICRLESIAAVKEAGAG